MPTAASARIVELGIELPQLAAPVGSYLPYKLLSHGSSHLLFTSGMIPTRDGQPICSGLLGGGVSINEAQECARLCVLNALAWVQHAGQRGLDGRLGLTGLDHISEVLQVRGFVASTPDFAQHPLVLNAASDLLVDIFGDAGRHTRSAVGCSALPLNVPVEIDFLFAL